MKIDRLSLCSRATWMDLSAAGILTLCSPVFRVHLQFHYWVIRTRLIVLKPFLKSIEYSPALMTAPCVNGPSSNLESASESLNSKTQWMFARWIYIEICCSLAAGTDRFVPLSSKLASSIGHSSQQTLPLNHFISTKIGFSQDLVSQKFELSTLKLVIQRFMKATSPG